MTALSHTAPRPGGIRHPYVAIGLAAWFALILWLALTGGLTTGPELPPVRILAAILLPPAAFALSYVMSRRVRDAAHAVDLRLLTALQAWRVVGAVFLFLYAFGILPGFFAWPAGGGDLLVGIIAVPALLAQIRQRPGWQRRVWWLNIAGVADFVAAVATGVLASGGSYGVLAGAVTTAPMSAFPLALIPGFFVPLFLILHAVSFLQLRRLVRQS